MTRDEQVYIHLANLLAYPEAERLRHLNLLQEKLSSEEATGLKPFADFADTSQYTEMEELFTRTFDMNPSTCLEIGWHLYGEDYERGRFLVAMRESLREYGLPESNELPDHLSHCLQLFSCLPSDVAEGFAKRCLQPALEKIVQNLGEDNPYRCLLVLVRDILQKRYGAVASANANHSLQIVTQSKQEVCNCSC